MEVAEAHKLPLITATGAGTQIYEQGYRYVFGLMSPARLYLAGTLEVIRRLTPSSSPRVALLSCRDFAALEDAIETTKFAVGKGFRVVSLAPPLPSGFQVQEVEARTESGAVQKVEILTYPDGEKNFKEVLVRMKALDLDLFLATGHLGEGVALVRQAKEAELNPRGFGLSVGPAITAFRAQLTAMKVSPEHLFGAAQWTENVPIVGHDPFITPAEFTRAFSERFNMTPSYLSAGGYACGIVLQEALKRAGTAAPDPVRKAIATLDIKTFYAPIRIDSRGLNATKPMYTIQLRSNDKDFDEVILWPPQGAVWPRPSQRV